MDTNRRDYLSLYMDKTILAIELSEKIAELEKIIADQRVELNKFKRIKKLIRELREL